MRLCRTASPFSSLCRNATRSLSLAALFCATALPLRADTFTTLQFSNAMFGFGEGGVTYGTLNGTLTLDETTQSFTDLNAVWNYNGAIVAAFTSIELQGSTQYMDKGVDYYILSADVSNHGLLNLGLPISDLGPEGGPICTLNTINENACGSVVASRVNFGRGNETFLVSGDITPLTVAQTPEPSSLLLLSTGLLGALGAARRRLR